MKQYILKDCMVREETDEEEREREEREAAEEAAYWENVDYGEAVDKLIRERYSLSAELAILRQKDEKPHEYEVYYSFCEECKEFVKSKKGIES